MKTISIYKAQPIGDRIPEDVTIEIRGEFQPSNYPATYDDVRKDFAVEADLIEKALINSLPGGTYDALFGLMCKRKASQFVVAFEDEKK